jgi:hypothetical protein
MTEFEAMMLSVAIEAPLAFAIVYLARWPCRGPLHIAIAITLATAVTHPQLWTASLVCGEALVILAEAAIIAWATRLSSAKSLIVSGIANGTSALAGLALFA